MKEKEKKKCVKCGSEDCIGFVLFHPKELIHVPDAKKHQLKKYPNAEFKLIDSTNRDGMPDGLCIKFKELHVIVKE